MLGGARKRSCARKHSQSFLQVVELAGPKHPLTMTTRDNGDHVKAPTSSCRALRVGGNIKVLHPMASTPTWLGA